MVVLRNSGDGVRTMRPLEVGRRVLLICPPFQALNASPLGIALLATVLRERGVVCEEAYPHFTLARIIGAVRYQRVIEGFTGLVGELLFAEGLHGTIADP